MAASVDQPLQSWRGILLALAVAAAVAAGLVPGGVDAGWALALGCGLALIWALRRDVWALAALLPLLSLLAPSWPALAGWTLAGMSLPALLALRRSLFDRSWRGRRARLRHLEHERDTMDRHLQRYPRLLEACLSLSAARETDQLATVLALQAQRLVPGLQLVEVHLAEGLRARWTRAGASALPTEEIHYVLAEGRALARRGEDVLRCIVPLRGQANGPAQHCALAVAFASRGIEDVLVEELVGALGRLAGLAMDGVELLVQAQALAVRDDLTGLYGRHEFLRRLDEQIATARRMRLRLGVIMCDMDYLKRYNDQWGHAVGDRALVAVAGAITAVLPDGAIACRYGGEEFAVLLPQVGQRRTFQLASDLCQAVRSLPAVSGAGTGPLARLSCSVGWAVWDDRADGATLLAQADEACYQAKAAGRDRVVPAAPTRSTETLAP